MKLRYEPNLAAGGVTGATLALLTYYGVLDVEAAGLWAVLIAAVAPIVQAWVARLFTTPTAKLNDAGIHEDTVNAQAAIGRRARRRGARR